MLRLTVGSGCGTSEVLCCVRQLVGAPQVVLRFAVAMIHHHADPHPGNLLKTLDGRLAYIDFGMMGSIEPPVRQALIRATLHLVNREFERLAEDFVALGLLPRGADMDEVIPALTGVQLQTQARLVGLVVTVLCSCAGTPLPRAKCTHNA